MEIIKLIPSNLNRTFKKTVQVIKNGGVVVCPTDTVYGLVADATNKTAVAKVFKIKKRNYQKPVPVFIKNIKMAKSLAIINKEQEVFLKKIWPGTVTTVLKARSTELPRRILSKDKKIGFRIPKHKLLNDLLDKLNQPLVATSANISGKKPSGEIKKILAQFKDKKYKPDLVLSRGNLKPSLPSTVIDVSEMSMLRSSTDSKIKILRQGAISKKRILEILNNLG